MLTRKPLLAASLVVVAVAITACGSPSDDDDVAAGASIGAESGDAEVVAEALGIDLKSCGSDPTAELTGDIKVGQSYAMSGGPATAFAPVGNSVKVAFQDHGDKVGSGTKFTLIQNDDQFMPDKALTAAQELIDKDRVAAMTTTIGTATVLGVRPLLEAECVPMINAVSGGASANDPGKFPWTVPFTFPSALDARIWMEDIAAKHPDGAKVAMFYANDSSGKEFFESVKTFLGETKSTLVASQTVENTDSASPASQVTTLRNSGATVLLAAPTGAQCATLMKEVAGQGWKPEFYMSSTCPAALFDVAGPAADGVFVNAYIKDPARPPYDTDPDVLEAVATIKKYLPDAPINNAAVSGLMYASPFFVAAEQAAESELGLSRLGLLEAATHMSFQPKLTIPGIKYQLDYPKDQVAMEAGELQQYAAATKTFKKIELYDFEGQMTGSASVG